MNRTETKENLRNSKTSRLVLDCLLVLSGLWTAGELFDFDHGHLELDLEFPEVLLAFGVFAVLFLVRRSLKHPSESPDLFSSLSTVIAGASRTAANSETASAPAVQSPFEPLEGVCCFSASGARQIHYANDLFSELTGYPKDQLAAQECVSVCDFLLPEEQKQFEDDLLRAALDGQKIYACYRLRHRDGRVTPVSACMKAVKDSNGKTWIHLLFLQTNSHSVEALEKERKRNEILLGQRNDIVFEIDVQNDTITYSMNWENKLASKIPTDHVSQRLQNSELIHPDDIPAMSELLASCTADGAAREQKVRLYGKMKKYIWCIVRLCGVKDQDGKVVQLIGTAIDCDRESEEVEQLRRKAEIDGLTGLYNKYTIQEKISSYLTDKRDAEHGLFLMIDMDNFKHVNDCYGHHTGDLVLQKTGEAIAAFAARHGGEAGRIGGDEFIVFLYDLPDIGQCEALCHELHACINLEIPGSDERFTGSVGYSPTCSADNFETLYMKADKCLYEQKKSHQRQRPFA